MDYPREQILEFSPNTKSILELRSEKDLEILTKIYENGVLLGDDSEDGWGIEYSTEFHMGNDSDLFAPRPQFENNGYRPDEYGHWLKGDWRPVEDFGFDPDKHRTDPHRGHWLIQDRHEPLFHSRDGEQAVHIEDLDDFALPLYEGRIVGQFDYSQKGWVSGRGRAATWRQIPWTKKELAPQYLLGKDHYNKLSKAKSPYKVGQLRVSSSTNTRTLISTTLYNVPCGDKVAILRGVGLSDNTILPAAINSYILDFVARKKVGGLQVDQHILNSLPLPRTDRLHEPLHNAIIANSVPLLGPSLRYSFLWRSMWLSRFDASMNWRKYWALTTLKRRELRCRLDALLAFAYGISRDDFRRILAETDRPTNALTGQAKQFSPPLKGFWRVGKTRPPELRQTVLSQVAFDELKKLIRDYGNQRKAIQMFAGTLSKTKQPSNENLEGWTIPQDLRLRDYDLGHDDRANEPQPVASELGPRYFDWQLEQDADESWEECRQHAELIEEILPSQKTIEESEEEGEAQQNLGY
jgi:hypothetical protein